MDGIIEGLAFIFNIVAVVLIVWIALRREG